MAREQDFITLARVYARAIWDAVQALDALKAELDANGGESWVPAEGAGENAGITRAEVVAVVDTTRAALQTTLADGHATNLARLL